MLGVCPKCRYSLRGLPSSHSCPECGARYDEQSGMWRSSQRHRRFYLLATVGLGIALIWNFWVFRAHALYAVWIGLALGAAIFYYFIIRPIRTDRSGMWVAVTPEGITVRYADDRVYTIPWNRVTHVDAEELSAYVNTDDRDEPWAVHGIFKNQPEVGRFVATCQHYLEQANEPSRKTPVTSR